MSGSPVMSPAIYRKRALLVAFEPRPDQVASCLPRNWPGQALDGLALDGLKEQFHQPTLPQVPAIAPATEASSMAKAMPI